MTRKALARESGVSERYLAQLEGGQGNISIALMRQIARAMGMDPADFVRDSADPPIELSLLIEYVSRLGPHDLTLARELLIDRFGASRDRARRIALIGLRGAGKSTIGNLLGRRLRLPVIELARQIEIDVGMKLDEIFALSGQAAYRRYERRSLEHMIETNGQAVIVMSGGGVSEPGTFEMLLHSCFTIWLRASPEEHMRRVIAQGDKRPMAGNPEAMEDLRHILHSREALYAKADLAIDTSDQSPQEVVATILAALPHAPVPA